MTTEYSKNKWIEAGYEFFAANGPDQLQVEKMARYLGLNKSGFYHYFGDREVFIEELMSYHKKRIDVFAREIIKLKSFEEYIQLIVNNKQTTLFHVQLSRQRQINGYAKILDCTNSRIFPHISPLWSEYVGLKNHPDLAMKYFFQVVGLFVKSVNSKNLSTELITSIANDTKQLLKQLQRTKD